MTDHSLSGPLPAVGLGGPASHAAGPATHPSPGPAGTRGGLPDAPDSWYDAEEQAPHHATPHTPLPRRTRISAIPIRREGPAVAYATAAAGGFIAGSAWYFADVFDEYSGPWTPITTAILIAVPVRLFSRAHPSHRTLASLVTYLVVLLSTLMLLTHHDLVGVYGWIEDYRVYEYSVVRTRLRDPLHLTVYVAGALLAAIIPRLGSRK